MEILYQQCTNQPLFQDDDSPEDMKRGSCKLLMCVGIKLCGLVTLIFDVTHSKNFSCELYMVSLDFFLTVSVFCMQHISQW